MWKAAFSRSSALCALTFALISVPAVSQTTLETVRASGEIRFAVDAPYGKMEFYDADGTLTGIDIDIARQVAKRLKVKPKFLVMPFAELFGAIDERRTDLVISAVTITAERQEKMRFSVPYFDAALRIVVRKQDASIQTLNDLKMKRIGVLKGTVGETFAGESPYLNSGKVVVFTSNEARVEALERGEVDGIIMHFSLKGHATLRTLGEPLSQSYYGLVAHLDDVDLMNAVNQALRDLQARGELTKIKQAYLN